MATTPGGKGAAVVKEVVDTINGLGIFPYDHKFLCRVAWVESKYGQDKGTYRPGYYGGIWQVINQHFPKCVISLSRTVNRIFISMFLNLCIFQHFSFLCHKSRIFFNSIIVLLSVKPPLSNGSVTRQTVSTRLQRP